MGSAKPCPTLLNMLMCNGPDQWPLHNSSTHGTCHMPHGTCTIRYINGLADWLLRSRLRSNSTQIVLFQIRANGSTNNNLNMTICSTSKSEIKLTSVDQGFNPAPCRSGNATCRACCAKQYSTFCQCVGPASASYPQLQCLGELCAELLI